MLFERITYPEDFPIRITVAEVVEDPLHYHLDIEFIYVLKGEVTLKNGYCHYRLREGDLFTNSGHEVHSLTAGPGENVAALIQISTHYFAQYFPQLSKACYRTYSTKAEDQRRSRLKHLTLQLLMKYSARGFNYKSECIYLMVDILKHLEKYFNLFAFDKNVVVGFDRSNQLAVERISRICRYIYQYYAQNITLKDLSEMEHLSPFYLSHLITSFTGMNFRNFLCFARVEWSEILLLDSDKKISQIAGEVGFSSTAYYEKYFQKWFRRTPQEHRAYYLPLVKSDLRPAVLHPLPPGRVNAMVKRAYGHTEQDRDVILTGVSLEVEVDLDAPVLGTLDTQTAIAVTCGDFRALGPGLFHALDLLAAGKAVLLQHPGDRPEDAAALFQLLVQGGFSPELRIQPPATEPACAAYDSIAYPISLLRKNLGAERLELRLRDPGDPEGLLQGQPALLTGGGIKKPVFYAAQLLAGLKGELLCRSNRYWVIRDPRQDPPCYFLLVCNDSEAMQNACLPPAGAQQVKSAINGFKDELHVGLHLPLKPGRYAVVRYGMSKENNLFGLLSALDFPAGTAAARWFPRTCSGFPALEAYTEDVRTSFDLNISLKGAGVQLAMITRLPETQSPV